MLQSILRGAAIACALCVSVVTLSMPASDVVIAQGADSALGKVQEGIRLYKKGDYRGAISKFDEALAANPTDEEARKIRDEINERLALDMANNNFADSGLRGRYERFGKWILAGRKKSGYPSREKNNELIAQVVADYMSDPNDVRNFERGNQIRDRFGDFAVPEIAEKYMGSDNQSFRYRARALLARLGAQAVNPLIQCMQSDNALVRQTAALALSDIADPRALPVLAQHFQMRGEDPQVVEACRLGVSKIRAMMPESDRKIESARELWFLQAESYYRNNAAGGYTSKNRMVGTTYAGQLPVLLTGHERTYTSWKWVANAGERKLIDQEVPLWAYADVLAEESALMAIDQGILAAGGNANADKFVMGAEALLACIHVHLYTEAMGRYHSGNDAERAFIVGLVGVRGMVPNMRGFGLAGAAGTARLYMALDRSLADGYPEVTIGLCDLIAEQDAVDFVGSDAAKPLVKALTDVDRRVRYAAARTLLQLAREKDFGNNTMVEQLITTCLQETAARSVLIIAEDEGLRNELLTQLSSLKLNVVAERTLEDGARAATLQPLFDAIIIQGDIALSPTFYWEPQKDSFSRETHTRLETIFDLLAADIRTAQIPIFVACKDADMTERKSTLAPRLNNETFTDASFFGYDAEYKMAVNALYDALKNKWDRNPENAKNKTNRLVEQACHAMHKLNPASTKYNVKALLVALAGGLRLEGRTAEARAAIGNAIAHIIGDSRRADAAWVAANIVPVLVDTLNSEDRVDNPVVRAAACKALGSCFRYYPQSFGDAAYQALLKMLRYEVPLGEEPEGRLENAIREVNDARNAAGVALGNAPLTAQQRQEVRRAQQVFAHEAAPDKRTAK